MSNAQERQLCLSSSLPSSCRWIRTLLLPRQITKPPAPLNQINLGSTFAECLTIDSPFKCLYSIETQPFKLHALLE
jgi:hypothetical protein